MKKSLLVLALLLLPIAAMAGMSAVTDKDLAAVKGQTGITLQSGMQIAVGSLAWGDSDGFGTYTTAGWLILSSISLPSFHSGCMIDVGGTASNSYLQITSLPGAGISGDLTIGSVIIGSSANATTRSLGEVRISNISVTSNYTRISGH